MVCGQRNNSACLADWVEQKTHTACCVLDRISTGSLLFSAAASRPQSQHVRLEIELSLGWDSHCFHCQTPKAKCYKPLKRWAQVNFKLWKQTKKYVKEGQRATNGRWMFLNQQILWGCFSYSVDKGQSQSADQGFFQKCLIHITAWMYLWDTKQEFKTKMLTTNENKLLNLYVKTIKLEQLQRIVCITDNLTISFSIQSINYLVYAMSENEEKCPSKVHRAVHMLFWPTVENPKVFIQNDIKQQKWSKSSRWRAGTSKCLAC